MTAKRAIRTIKEITEDGVVPSKALRKNGYTEAYAHNPQKFMQTNQVQKWLMEHYPDDLLAQVGLDGLKANKIHGTGDDFIEIPDHDARYKYWRDIMKARGKMVENEGNTYNQVNISWDSGGYTPPNNLQQLTQTYTPKKPK